MWIAKPLLSLSPSETDLWEKIEENLPLAQTLVWARATEAVSRKTFLIFSPEEKVGGIVFRSPDPASPTRSRFECINGPHLHWDDALAAPRQLATFAMAVSKLDRTFQSLALKPRWVEGQLQDRLRHLPLSLFCQSQAETMIIPIQSSLELQFQALSRRMRRNLQRAWRNEVKVRWEPLTPDSLGPFYPSLKLFGDRKGFSVPPRLWFDALLKGTSPRVRFYLSTAFLGEDEFFETKTQILVCMRRNRAHYLFGYDERSAGARPAISTSAAAHWETLGHCLKSGIEDYDLNGYMTEIEPTHPYFGVTRFKEQFQGQVVRFEIPEFMIS